MRWEKKRGGGNNQLGDNVVNKSKKNLSLGNDECDAHPAKALNDDDVAFQEMMQCQVVRSCAGFRPFRPSIRRL